jgi:hypothetical protein
VVRNEEAVVVAVDDPDDDESLESPESSFVHPAANKRFVEQRILRRSFE